MRKTKERLSNACKCRVTVTYFRGCAVESPEHSTAFINTDLDWTPKPHMMLYSIKYRKISQITVNELSERCFYFLHQFLWEDELFEKKIDTFKFEFHVVRGL
jgi:hypothetical protein